ncbi:unnamed protein product (macronuclear) [Paramecium tetraurelia]|uniref:Protein kinase domain-containing protein n=1 Tax=Paramecium tetraurelia TaxID=5888 RepID=A0CKT6_PARTE|nr:uncharacterized protein GSPATT00007949001 [Paramecium tetraurelia]CAK71403.1 unnamed protein product [Paramecium tetraurelia]|eukprot:XP_001438800.1 hypothetical protein (macronuclear) [Paramecium tetraurelia strain d4-2]
MRPDFFMEKNIRILEKIGQGAFGQVYKGLYKNEEVAIKFLQDAQIQETSIMENLQHKNIIKFYQVVYFIQFKYFKQGNCQYLVMEYAAGGSLKELMKQSLDELTISQIMESIFTGIEYLHSKQIIHRDIKPDNILIKNTEDLSSIKIADFGLSYQYKPEIRYYQTVSKQCGTFIFMAPEQILNKTYNKAVDMWSCGIVLYMLLNQGKHPFFPRIFTKKEFINSFPDFKYEQPLHVSPLARDLLQRLLQNDQDSRYTAAQALVHPWITRKFNDPIPMCVKQFGICQEQKRKNFQLLQSVLFIIYLQQISIKQSPNLSKKDLNEFKILIAELEEDKQEQQQNLGNISPKNQQIPFQLSIARPTKIFKAYRTLNRTPSKEKHYRLNAILNQKNESSKELNMFKFNQQHSIDNDKRIVPFDPDSPMKNSKSVQPSKVLLPALSESTQTSLSPSKLTKVPIVKHTSFRKTGCSFFLGLNRINNNSVQESETVRSKEDIHDKGSIINTQRSTFKQQSNQFSSIFKSQNKTVEQSFYTKKKILI